MGSESIKKTGLVRDKRFTLHDPGYGHPESPMRLESIYSLFSRTGLFEKNSDVMPVEAEPADILAVHTRMFYDFVLSTRGEEHYFDADTSTSPGSVEAALLAAGGTVKLVDEIVAGKLDNGFALVRPPGHHAEPWKAMGFCVFNNVAIAARHATNVLGLERVLIFDWDIHHGNGTQDIFYDDPKVLYISTHRYPYYPGTGGFDEIGAGPGEGYTIDVPLPPRMGDAEFNEIIERVVTPAAERFKPELILVSAGYDCAKGDPLGDMAISVDGFAMMTSKVMELAAGFCKGRVAMALEGGYNIEMLSRSVQATVETLMGVRGRPQTGVGPAAPILEKVISEVARVHGSMWGIR